MSPSSVQGGRPRPWGRIEKDLRRLHRNGLGNPPLHELRDLVEAARGLSTAPTDHEKVIDALARAIDACWGGASREIPSLRDTMRLWFGLPSVDDPTAPDTQALSSAERHMSGWEYWVRPESLAGVPPKEAQATFRTNKARDRYIALAQKIVQLESDAARQIPTPAAPSTGHTGAPLTTDLPAAPADTGAQQRKGRWSRRRPRVRTKGSGLARLAASFTLVIAAGAIGVVWAPWSSSGRSRIPPYGAIVNAQTGAWSMTAPKTPVEYPTDVGGGEQVGVCDLTTSPGCPYYLHSTLYEPVKVRSGDTLAFAFVLNNGYTSAIPYMSISATVNYIGHSPGAWTYLGLVVSVAWPSYGRLGSGTVTTREANIREAFLQIPKPTSYGLRYLPGTSTLQFHHPYFFHYLPDGIMGPGIALQDVGEPANCYPCAAKYIRRVRFEARVVTRAHL
jgi:hypothetical protein